MLSDYFGESKNVEFKREIPARHDKLLKDIIAFANTNGGKCITIKINKRIVGKCYYS